jgi:hypothetical protein
MIAKDEGGRWCLYPGASEEAEASEGEGKKRCRSLGDEEAAPLEQVQLGRRKRLLTF